MKVTPGQFVWHQICATVPPVVEQDLTGKTIIVTGANTGLGFEASKHVARMKAGKVIIACRDQQRGDEVRLSESHFPVGVLPLC